MKKRIRSIIITILLCAAYLIFFRILHVPTASMEPTISSGSFVLMLRIHPTVQRGQVIAFWHEDRLLVKRVAYIGGDTIPVLHTADADGTPLIVPVADEDADTYLTVPEGCVFVLGDNQDNSSDSRYWEDPFVQVDQIEGLIIIPWTNK